MSDTPRTDAVSLDERDAVRFLDGGDGTGYIAWTDYWALRKHARQLERELSGLNRSVATTVPTKPSERCAPPPGHCSLYVASESLAANRHLESGEGVGEDNMLIPEGVPYRVKTFREEKEEGKRVKKKAPRRTVVKFYRFESNPFLGDMTLSCGHVKLWDSDRRPPATTQCWECVKPRSDFHRAQP